MVKFDNFSTKMIAYFKKINSFLSKKYSVNKLISRNNEQPNTLTRQEYKSKIYVKNIRKNLCRIRKQLKSRILIQKNHPDSQQRYRS
jgi:hypothetical protein